jgi:hypothetical protein
VRNVHRWLWNDFFVVLLQSFEYVHVKFTCCSLATPNDGR